LSWPRLHAGPNRAEQVRIAIQIQRPARVAADAVGNRLPARAVAVQIAVFEVDAGAPAGLAGFRGEADLDLAGLGLIGLRLPGRADIPAEHHAVGGLVDQYARPPAHAAVDAAVVDVPAYVGLEHRFGDRDSEQIVLARLEIAEPLGEHGERAL